MAWAGASTRFARAWLRIWPEILADWLVWVGITRVGIELQQWLHLRKKGEKKKKKEKEKERNKNKKKERKINSRQRDYELKLNISKINCFELK